MEGYGNENPGAFQSTRPLRGATATTTSSVVHALFQPMRPLRGATAPLWRRSRRSRISTHAPLAGRDTSRAITVYASTLFQPTRPLRGATPAAGPEGKTRKFQPARPLRGATNFILMKGWSFYISTHAPLAGRDIRELCPQEGQNSFQPTRPLRGATFRRIDLCFDVIIFQPTRPLRGATCER